MSKAKTKWQQHSNDIPGLSEAISRTAATTDADTEYGSLLAALPSAASERLRDDVETGLEHMHQLIEHHWCLYESPEGEFPRVFVFPSRASLVEAVSKREGKEVAVWVMYGVPLRLTKLTQRPGSQDAYDRYLLLPNQMAVKIASGDVQLLEQGKLPSSVEVQDDGWLGDPALTESGGFFKPGFTEQGGFDEDEDEGSTSSP